MERPPADPGLERALLRRSVGALVADRAHCSRCGRTPLVGETVHGFEDGRQVCALCLPQERATPQRSEAVRGAAWGTAVRPRADRPRDAERRRRRVPRAA